MSHERSSDQAPPGPPTTTRLTDESISLLNRLSKGASRWDDIRELPGKVDLSDVDRECASGRPLEHVLGFAPFVGRLFQSDGRALIPRNETELLARVVLDRARDLDRSGLTVFDIGTGSGNLGITLALEFPDCRVYASDVSSDALALASENIATHGVADRVSVHEGSVYEPFAGLDLESTVDLVVCNPPYIPTRSLQTMDPSIRDNEPRAAFDGGSFGLEIVRALVDGTETFLRPGGMLVFEIGAGQDRLMTRLLGQREHIENVTPYENDDGVVRVLSAQRR